MSYTPELEIQQDIPLKDKLLSKGFWLYFFAFVLAPTGYIIKLLAARAMSVEDVGVFYSILGLIGIIASYNDLGLTESLQYFLPHYLIDKDYIKAKSILITSWIIQFISGIIIGGGLWLLAPWLAEHYFQSSQAVDILRWLCIYFFIINILQVIQSLFLGLQDTKTSHGIDAIRMWVVVGGTVVLFFNHQLTSITLAYLWIIGLVAGTGVAGYVFRRRFSRMMMRYPFVRDRTLFRQWIGYAWRVFLGANTFNLFNQIDLQFALYFLGKEAAGYWTMYLSLLTGISLLTSPLSTYLFPLVNELIKKDHQQKLKLLVRYIGCGLIVSMIVVGLVLYYLGPWIATLLFGGQFVESGRLLQFAAPVVMFGPAMGFAFSYLAGLGKVKQRVWILLGGLVATIAANLILIPLYGLYGIIISMALSWVVMGCGVRFVLGRKY